MSYNIISIFYGGFEDSLFNRAGFSDSKDSKKGRHNIRWIGCQRCVQTSEQLAKVLKLPVRAVPGLGECAGAVRQSGMTRASFRPDAELRRHCGSSAFSVDPALLGFQVQLEQLAAVQGPNLLVVTHREGMRDVSDLTATPFRYSPYCCLAHYRYHLQTGQWEVVRAPELDLL
eukprot:EG_transcript_16513